MTKKQVQAFIESHPGYTTHYSGKFKTIFIRGTNPEHMELLVLRKFNNLPFGVTSATSVRHPYNPAAANWEPIKVRVPGGGGMNAIEDPKVIARQLKVIGINKSTGKRMDHEGRGAFGHTLIGRLLKELKALPIPKTDSHATK